MTIVFTGMRYARSRTLLNSLLGDSAVEAMSLLDKMQLNVVDIVNPGTVDSAQTS